MVTMVNLDAIVDKVLTRKIGKYVGYSLEAGGVCGIVYGIFTGDNYTTACGGFAAYFGTVVYRSFNYLGKEDKGRAAANKNKTSIENKI